MKHRQVCERGCGTDISIMFVCSYAGMALQEGQAVLLEVALKNVLPSEAGGQRLYSLLPGKSAAWGHTAQVTMGSREGAGGTQHLPRHIPAWNEQDHCARVSQVARCG